MIVSSDYLTILGWHFCNLLELEGTWRYMYLYVPWYVINRDSVEVNDQI